LDACELATLELEDPVPPALLGLLVPESPDEPPPQAASNKNKDEAATT
jgi:hypothetical protein